MKEEWRDIVGYEDNYQVSNFGNVKSKHRNVSNHTGIIHLSPRLMSKTEDAKGYLRVYLSKNGIDKFVPIHRLVAKAFIPNPDNKPQVNHKDGNKKNNNVNNLEWCTNSENQLHAYKYGLNKHSNMSGKTKRPVLQINPTTKEIIREFPSIAEATRITNSKNIGECCRNKYGRKTANGFEWKFKETIN